MSKKRKRKQKRAKKVRTSAKHPLKMQECIEIKVLKYVENPSLVMLDRLLSLIKNDNELSLLYEKMIDDKSVFTLLSGIEVASIFYATERFIECQNIVKDIWSKEKCLISLDYLFLTAVKRSDLHLAHKALIEIENNIGFFSEAKINSYRIKYGLISGNSKYALKVAHHSIQKSKGDVRLNRVILQLALRLEDATLINTILVTNSEKKLVTELSKQQESRMKRILIKHLINLLRAHNE